MPRWQTAYGLSCSCSKHKCVVPSPGLPEQASLSAVPLGLYSVPHRWPRVSWWEGKNSSAPQPLASRLRHMKQLPWSQGFFTDLFFRKFSAERWDEGELLCGDKGLSCPLEFGVPGHLFPCYRLFSELVQGESGVWEMCWSLMPAPVSWSTSISLPPRRMGLTTSGAPAGWDWAGVFFSIFFSRFFIWRCHQTLRFCTGTVEIQVM